MAEQRETVETACDRLLELVQQKGKVSLRDASKDLGVSEPVLEEIANVLAEQKILKVKYGFTGTFFEPMKVTKEEAEKGISEAKKRASAAKVMDDIGLDVSASERAYRRVEDDVLMRMRKAEELLACIEEEEREATDEERAYLLKEAKKLDEVVKAFGSDIKDIKDEVVKLTEKLREFEAETSKGKKEKKPGLLGGLFGRLGRKR